MRRTFRGRLAPSPTGALHLGNIRTFMLAWLQMRSLGGEVLLRIEDLDHPKHKPGADAQMIDELRWLGFDWEGEVVWQRQRMPLYHAALQQLSPSLYPCRCTRADIANAQSAPHPGEVLRYPGTCRARTFGQEHWTATPADEKPPAWRLALEPETYGDLEREAAALTGDFVVARGAEPAYTLAVVVDDAAQGVTHVLRGDDILPATPAQRVVYRRLGLREPEFTHVPLVVGPDGRRLAKRHGDTRIAAYRAAGVAPGRILSALARSCGWAVPSTLQTLADLQPYFTLATLPPQPFVWEEHLLG